ncbi:MAG: polymer-forming cytoskeletal protein [bacterium]
MKVTLISIWLVVPIFAIKFNGHAAEFMAGGNKEVAAEDTVRGDLYVGCATLNVEGTVDGGLLVGAWRVNIEGTITHGLMAGAQFVEVRGDVWEDVNAAGQIVEITGNIGRSIRAAGAEVIIAGHVLGDVIASGGEVTIAKEAVVEGEVYAAADKFVLSGYVEKSVKANAATILLSGQVEGDVEFEIAEELEIAPTASIGGMLTYKMEWPLETELTDIVGGTINYEKLERGILREHFSTFRLIYYLWSLLAAIIVGVLIVTLIKERLQDISDKMQRHPMTGILLGIGFLVLGPAAILISVFLLFTIPLGALFLVFYLIALYVSRIFAGSFLGRLILNSLGDGKSSPYWETILGVFVIYVFITLPVVGKYFHIIFVIVGLGVMVFGIQRLLMANKGEVAVE